MKPRITLHDSTWTFYAAIIACLAFVVLIILVNTQSRQIAQLKQEVSTLNTRLEYWLPPKGKGGRI